MINSGTLELINKEQTLNVDRDLHVTMWGGGFTVSVWKLSRHEFDFKVDLQQQHVTGVLQFLWLTRGHNYRLGGLVSHR